MAKRAHLSGFVACVALASFVTLAQAPPGTPPKIPGPLDQRRPEPRSSRDQGATQGQLAVALATKLGLGENLTEERAIGFLAAAGLVPETGWNSKGPATDVFVVQIQRSIHVLLSGVAQKLGIPVPPTLNLMIFTPGQMSGQTFVVRPEDMAALRAPSTGTDADKLRAGESAQASIETPHPYPIGDGQLPVVWSYRLRHPSASFIKIHFARLELAAPDHVRVLDRYGQERWRYVGGSSQTADIWANSVDGDTAIVVVHADAQGSGWGFKIDRYGYGTLPALSPK